MRSKFIIVLAVLFYSVLSAQETSKEPGSDFVRKGTFYMGVRSSLAFGIVIPDNRFVLPSFVNPEISYFIADRLSITGSYQGLVFNDPVSQRRRSLHNVEITANYYFYTRKQLLFYAIGGIAVEQYSPRGFRNANYVNVTLKTGAGMSWRPKALPNLGVKVEAAYYTIPRMGFARSFFPDLSVGVGYYFGKKKAKLAPKLEP